MNFDVEVSPWVMPTVVAVLVSLAALFWRDVGRRFGHNSPYRYLLRGALILGVVALTVRAYFTNAAAIRVRGDRLEVRNADEWDFRTYTISQVASYKLETHYYRRRSGYRSEDVLVLRFKDDEEVSVPHDYRFTERLMARLATSGIPQRPR
jgi:hypothetical protein